jgi:heme A synthase
MARASAWLLLASVLGQGLLGVLTVVLRVPLGVAVVHQGGAYVLCGATVLFIHAVLSAAPTEARSVGDARAPSPTRGQTPTVAQS